MIKSNHTCQARPNPRVSKTYPGQSRVLKVHLQIVCHARPQTTYVFKHTHTLYVRHISLVCRIGFVSRVSTRERYVTQATDQCILQIKSQYPKIINKVFQDTTSYVGNTVRNIRPIKGHWHRSERKFGRLERDQ